MLRGHTLTVNGDVARPDHRKAGVIVRFEVEELHHTREGITMSSDARNE
jgi:hypothetical protein